VALSQRGELATNRDAIRLLIFRRSRQSCEGRRRPAEDRSRRPVPSVALDFDPHLDVDRKRISVLWLAPWELSVPGDPE
jgi:hypothetical protein